MIKFSKYLLLGVFSLVVMSCNNNDGSSPVSEGGLTQFSKQVTFAELQDTITSSDGEVRVEIRLLSDSLTARKVQVKEPNHITKKEVIESRITAINVDGESGTIRLELGEPGEADDLTISFSASGTDFKDEGSSEEDISFTEFVERVQAVLAGGEQPAVKARRNPPDTPQAPEDSSFFATDLELDYMADEPKIKINIDSDNLEVNAAPPPDGWIKVLGLVIAIEASEDSSGGTELEEELEDVEGELNFEGTVASVDLSAGSVTLTDGTVILIVEGTEIEEGSGDDDNLTSLSAAADALVAGKIVEAEGEGVTESTNPLTIVAIEIEFETEEEAEVGETVEFEDQIASVDVSGSTFIFADGTVVTMTGDTTIDPEGDLLTLQAVAEAVTAGGDVRAEGHGTVTSEGPPLLIMATDVKFETEEEEEIAGVVEFEDQIASVDVPGSTFTLSDGTIVTITVDTTIDPEGDLLTIQTVADAVEAGGDVRAEGDATVTSAGPPTTLSATDVKFETDEED